MRRLTASIGVAALLTATLAGCSAIPGSGGCTPAFDAGDSSSIVTGSGAEVDFPTPLVVTTPEVSVLEAGDGAQVRDGDQVDYSYSRFYGKDGQALGATDATGRIAAGLDDDAVSQALVCAHVGDRLALAATTAQAYGEGAGGTTIADDDTLVIVIEVTAAYLGKADGFNQLPKDGMPTVVTAVDGTPAVSVLAVTAPSSSSSSVIKAGDGAKLAKDDAMVIHIRMWTWPSTIGDEPSIVSKVDTWPTHQAANVALTSTDDGGGLPPALYDGLLGQRVGSQILVVLAPGDGSFPAGAGPSGDDATYIAVVDILGTQK